MGKMNELTSEPEIDFMILADRAESINGKLYMMGGAWDGIGVPGPGHPVGFNVAVGIVVPWNATNVEHQFRMRVEDADSKEQFVAGAGVNVGRPPGMPVGARQHVVFALHCTFTPPGADIYVMIGTIGSHEKRLTFFVQYMPHMMPGQAPQPR